MSLGTTFTFLSTDRQRGGHVLEFEALDVSVEASAMNEMHVSLPETEEFLKADLTRDPQEDLLHAELDHDNQLTHSQRVFIQSSQH